MRSHLQNVFNLSAVEELRMRFNLSSPVAVGGRKDDIASLLVIPGLDADALWRETAHDRHVMIKEVSIGRLDD